VLDAAQQVKKEGSTSTHAEAGHCSTHKFQRATSICHAFCIEQETVNFISLRHCE